ncbi:MAG: TrkA family potassium uptake protein [Anaerovibrio sp.]|nr:TrkA family potassium uptake protein [Anaerovibrio sp.]
MNKKKQFAILGLGRFGASLAMALENMGYEVLCVDLDERVVERLSGTLSRVVSFDIRDAKALAQVGIDSFDTVVITSKNLESSLMATMLCKEQQVPEIIVKAIDERHAEMATRLGATQMIFSERDMARRLAKHLSSPNVLDYIEIDADINVISFYAEEELQGKKLQDTDLRSKYGLNVIAIIRSSETIITPPPSFVFQEGDKVFAVGSSAALAKFENK